MAVHRPVPAHRTCPGCTIPESENPTVIISKEGTYPIAEPVQQGNSFSNSQQERKTHLCDVCAEALEGLPALKSQVLLLTLQGNGAPKFLLVTPLGYTLPGIWPNRYKPDEKDRAKETLRQFRHQEREKAN